MSTIRAIRTEADYQAALARIDALMDAEFGTPDGDELDVLTDLVEFYEARQVPMGYPSPIEAIRFRMEQGGSRRGIWSRSLAAGPRSPKSCPASVRSRCRWRVRYTRISASPPTCFCSSQGGLPSPLEGIEWQRFPLAAMAKLGWIAKRPNLLNHAEEVMRDLIRRAAASMSYQRPSTGRITRPGRMRKWIPMPSRPGVGKCSRAPIRCPSPPPTSPARSISHFSSRCPAELVRGRTTARTRISGEARYPSPMRHAPATYASRWRCVTACGQHARDRSDVAL